MNTNVINDIISFFPKYFVSPKNNSILYSLSGTIEYQPVSSVQTNNNRININVFEDDSRLIIDFNEELLEDLLNYDDDKAGYRFSKKFNKLRIYNKKIIQGLKKIYGGYCQICKDNPINSFGVDISEAHHIDYFVKSLNNNTSNIVILCPNHHNLIHKLNPSFDHNNRKFVFHDGKELGLLLNLHL